MAPFGIAVCFADKNKCWMFYLIFNYFVIYLNLIYFIYCQHSVLWNSMYEERRRENKMSWLCLSASVAFCVGNAVHA